MLTIVLDIREYRAIKTGKVCLMGAQAQNRELEKNIAGYLVSLANQHLLYWLPSLKKLNQHVSLMSVDTTE